MATAKKLQSGSWRVQTYSNGVRRSYTAGTKKEAERLAAIGLAEEKIKANSGLTLKDAISSYIDTCKAQGYSPSTIREYTSRAKNSYPLLASKRIDKLTQHDIQTQLDARINSGKSIKTVRNDWFLLRAVLFTYAPELNLQRVRIAHRAKRAKLIFKECWAAEILRTARSFWGEDDFYLYSLLILFAGLRPSESYALQWADISDKPIIGIDGIKAGTISIHAASVRGPDGYITKKPKTESGNRMLTVPWSLIEEITSSRQRGQGRVINMPTTTINWRWNKVKALLGIPPEIRFYDLRHYYATAVAASGATEEELAARMGHSTSTFSHAVYVELFEGRQTSVNAALFATSESAIRSSKSDADGNGDDTAKSGS